MLSVRYLFDREISCKMEDSYFLNVPISEKTAPSKSSRTAVAGLSSGTFASHFVYLYLAQPLTKCGQLPDLILRTWERWLSGTQKDLFSNLLSSAESLIKLWWCYCNDDIHVILAHDILRIVASVSHFGRECGEAIFSP